MPPTNSSPADLSTAGAPAAPAEALDATEREIMFVCAQCDETKPWRPVGKAKGKMPWPGAICRTCYFGGERK